MKSSLSLPAANLSDSHDKGVIMNQLDIVKQNRIARKKLKKEIKRQAEKRRKSYLMQSLVIDNLSAKVSELSSKNSDCAKLLDVAIREILDVVNFGEFSSHTPVTFDLSFMKITHNQGRFNSPTVRLPTNEDLERILKNLE